MQRIINNFYLRNLAVMLVFISPDILQALSKGTLFMPGDIYQVYFRCLFVIYFVFHNRVLYEKLLRKKKYFLYTLVFLSTLFAWRESANYLFWLLAKYPNYPTYQIQELKEYNGFFWFFIYWNDVMYTYIALGVYLSFKYFNENARLLQIQTTQRELELKQLNEQLNPHFLFNALNNIYSHLLRNSSDGKELVLKLSELMRYILDSSKINTVSLCNEVAFIENYIAFENERLGSRCKVIYRKEIKSARFKIVPLILFNFVENAFKHGTTSIHPSEIAIDIFADDISLKLSISNDICKPLPGSTKTGLGNTLRRLALLYPSAHNLNICDTDKKYSVALELNNIL